MKKIYLISLLLTLFIFSVGQSYAQAGYTLSGTVTNEKGEPLKGATVFIGGSERVTPTNDQGKFIFNNMPTGSYQVSVQLLGYASQTRNVIIKNAPVTVNIQLEIKTINLAQVNIGKKNASEKNLNYLQKCFWAHRPTQNNVRF